jgi:alkylated DNA repair dioxygenase AlkB
MQFDLFTSTLIERNPQIQLPGADLLYFERYFDQAISDRLFDYLVKQIAWKQDYIKMYGKTLPLPRLSAWYGDTDKPYSYSGINLQPLPWTDELQFIKKQIETHAGTRFSSVLINRYRDGQDYVGWHTDAEKELGQNPVIASVNFGATRKFQLRRIDNHAEKFEVELKHGTFLLMRGATQHYWQHQVPKTNQRVGERINLTFRCIQ